jgi:hypothetical protein
MIPLSGAQLVNTDETLALDGSLPGDIRERRRIEIRLRKSVPRDASLDALSGADALTPPRPKPMPPIVTRPYLAPLSLTPGR